MERSDIYHIYCLVDPRNNKPFYVGQTVNPTQRLSSHGASGSKQKRELIKQIKAARQKPLMRILEKTEHYSEARELEVAWIVFLMNCGFDILNCGYETYRLRRVEMFRTASEQAIHINTLFEEGERKKRFYLENRRFENMITDDNMENSAMASVVLGAKLGRINSDNWLIGIFTSIKHLPYVVPYSWDYGLNKPFSSLTT